MCIGGSCFGGCGRSRSKWTVADWNTIPDFSGSVAGFLTKFGLPLNIAQAFMTMCVSALALTSLDSVARIGRMSLQEFFYEEGVEQKA